jgi:hypothetical protein
MNERPFLDPSLKPAEQTLQAALGSMVPYYQEIMSLVSAYSQEWAFAKSSGWMLKVFDRKKALFYLIPLNDGFKISLTIRENERAAFLRNEELGMLQDKIQSAKKYPEGFALQFDIAREDEFQPFNVFIRKLIAMRA